MKLFNAILGIFAILGAVYCIFFPGLTFLSSGWVVTVLMGSWGLCAIFNYCTNRKDPDRSKKDAALGGVGLAVGIAAAVLSIIALFSPGMRAMFDLAIIGIFCGWLLISGFHSIAAALKTKKLVKGHAWIWTLILGILVLLTGIIGMCNIFLMGRTIGLLEGILLMVYGFRLLGSVFERSK